MVDLAPKGSVLVLYRDYKTDKDYQISIDKDLTIDGQGHTIDCNKKCRAFHSTSGNILLRNLKILKGHYDYYYWSDECNNGGAISILGSAEYIIENCCFENNWADDNGGAIYNGAENCLTIRNCTFKSNVVDDAKGGAIYSVGKLYIENSTFKDNIATDGAGGAIYVNSTLISDIINCLFESNQARSGQDRSGGAICSCYGLNLEGSRFVSNLAYDDGGAVFVDNSLLNVKNCIFDSNTVDGYSYTSNQGGAIATHCDIYINNSTFLSNCADNWGGAIFSSANIYINYDQSDNESYNTFFNGNYADDYNGGAISCRKNVYVKNARFSSNKAYTDGGAINLEGDSHFTHCMFDSNRCEGASSQCEGGAVFSESSIYMDDCIFSNNYAEDDGGAVYCENVANANGCTFTGNSAVDNGGAIYSKYVNINSDSKYGMSNFTSNEALDDNGGAIYAKCNVNAFNATFNSNSALVDGGAILCKGYAILNNCSFNSNKAWGAKSSKCYGGAIRSGSLSVNGCSFVKNQAENQGGAIFTDTFSSNVLNSQFIDNSAGQDGGAIYINDKNGVSFKQCTFQRNHAGDEGGAIYLDSTGSTLNLINNLFNGNSAKDGQVVFNKGSYSSIYNNRWADSNPSKTNNMLVEWHLLTSNTNHVDSAPLN